MTDTPNLNFTLLAAGQAQKHVTVNDALMKLDTVVQLTAFNRTQDSPPAAPAAGDTYIVGPSPTGSFAGQANNIASFDGAAWQFYAPSDGWLCYVLAEQQLFAFLATAWTPAALSGAPSQLGINSTADASNRLTVKSSASLFDHTGSGHQLKINKSAAAQTGSILLQTNYSGRAEIGLTGDDRLRCKVSSNGTSWKDALTLDQTTGLGLVFGPPVAANGIATKAYADTLVSSYSSPFDYQLSANQSITSLNVWTPVSNLTTARVASTGFDTAQSKFIAPAAGVYVFMAQVIATAGASATTITVAALKNGGAAGNWVSQSIAAGAQASTSFISLLSLAAGDAVGLGVYAQAPVTVNFGFTSFFGHRI